MAPIRVGVVGLSKEGWATESLIPPLLQHPLADKYSLTALSTTSEVSSSETAQKYSELAGHFIKPYYGDTSQIAADDNVDLVAVSVKAPAHKQAVLPAIIAGKDIFLEFPAGTNLQETREIAHAALNRGVRTLVGLSGRHSPTIQKLTQLLSLGRIGRIMSTSVIALAPKEIRNWGPWINDRTAYTADVSCGATMLDIAVGHMLDTFTYVLGDFTALSATTATQYPVAEVFDASGKPIGKTVPVSGVDYVAFTGILKSGILSSVTWRGGLPSTNGRKQFIWEIDGEEGSIRVENDVFAGAFMQVFEPKLYLNGELVSVEGDDLPNNSARAWLEFSKGKEGEFATIEDAVRLRTILDAISQSAGEGKRVYLE